MTMLDSSRPRDVATPEDGDVRRCWGCRKLWPRGDMRWGSVSEGPAWYARSIRVLRCPDCLE